MSHNYECVENSTHLKEVGIPACPEILSDQHNQWLGGFFTFFSLIGLVSNILNVYMFLKIYKRDSRLVQIILISIAISDFVEIFNFWTSFSFDYFFTSHSDGYQESRRSNLLGIQAFQAMSMTLNRWLIVLMSTERFYVVLRGTKGLQLHESRSKIIKLCAIIAALMFFSMMVNIPLVYEYDYIKCKVDYEDVFSFSFKTSGRACGKAWLILYSTIFMLLVNVFIPCVILFVVNAFVLNVLRSSAKAKRSASQAQAKRDDKAHRSVSLMCTTVAVVYLVLQLPYIVHEVAETQKRFSYCDKYECQEQVCPCMQNATNATYCDKFDVSKLTPTLIGKNVKVCHDMSSESTLDIKTLEIAYVFFLILNSSVNFFLYMGTSKTFRTEFIKMLTCGKYEVLGFQSNSHNKGPAMTNVRMKDLNSDSANAGLKDSSTVNSEQPI